MKGSEVKGSEATKPSKNTGLTWRVDWKGVELAGTASLKTSWGSGWRNWGGELWGKTLEEDGQNKRP